MLVSLWMKIISILITVILYVRMIEIYLYTSIAPVPLATMTNREWGQIGNNYASSEAKDSSTEIVTLTLIDDDSESGGDASREEEDKGVDFGMQNKAVSTLPALGVFAVIGALIAGAYYLLKIKPEKERVAFLDKEEE